MDLGKGRPWLSLLVVSLLLIGFSYPSMVSFENTEADGVKNDIEMEASGSGKVYVLVNSSVYPQLQGELQQYKEDVESQGWNVSIFNNTYSTPEDIRAFLADGYNNHGLVGAFFVGNLPYAQFEIYDGFEDYCRFPIDHFYTDLDGQWYDSDGNGIYDDHETSWGGIEDPEIWFGRISMKTNWSSEVQLYSNYFDKIHQYRVGNISLPHESLLYVDDDWKNYTDDYKSGMKNLYSDITIENDTHVTNATDYRKRLQEGYEWIQIHCHANHRAWRHAFKDDYGAKGSGGNFTSWNLSQRGQKSLFANVFTCGSANYTVQDYLCGWYALTENYGLANVGSTKPGSMLYFGDYYQPLSEGKCMGQAMKEWWIQHAESDRRWFYGMTTIGDPTLSPLRQDTNPPGNVTDTRGEVEGSDVVLNWSEPDTRDVHHYMIYRSTSPSFDFSNVYHNTSTDAEPLSTKWIDQSAATEEQTYYYIVRAVDCGWNRERNEVMGMKWHWDMHEGWNLISFPVKNSQESLTSVLDSVKGSYDKAMYYDRSHDEWKTYHINRESHFNDLEVVNKNMGLWVNMTSAASLAVGGQKPDKTNITLKPGWNLVGYPSRAASILNATLPEQVTKVAFFNGSRKYNLEYVQNLSSREMTWGEGYWVYNGAEQSVNWHVEF